MRPAREVAEELFESLERVEETDSFAERVALHTRNRDRLIAAIEARDLEASLVKVRHEAP